MDKYEFNIKVEQIKKLVNKRDYETAMKIADSIDWRRVRNANLLSMVAQVYEKNEEYQEAKDILLLAFERAPIGKRLLFKLTELALKEGDVEEAEAYYREFCDLAPDDSRQHLLRYLILKEKGATMEQQLHSLEKYTKEELDEKWLYELATLYHEAGDSMRCVNTCDKIMLMFGLGKYVDKAMELKVQYAPLTQYQMDLVENRDKYEAKLRAVEQSSGTGDEDDSYESGDNRRVQPKLRMPDPEREVQPETSRRISEPEPQPEARFRILERGQESQAEAPYRQPEREWEAQSDSEWGSQPEAQREWDTQSEGRHQMPGREWDAQSESRHQMTGREWDAQPEGRHQMQEREWDAQSESRHQMQEREWGGRSEGQHQTSESEWETQAEGPRQVTMSGREWERRSEGQHQVSEQEWGSQPDAQSQMPEQEWSEQQDQMSEQEWDSPSEYEQEAAWIKPTQLTPVSIAEEETSDESSEVEPIIAMGTADKHDLVMAVKEAEVEEHLAEEMSKISFRDYSDDEASYEKTRVLGDLRSIKRSGAVSEGQTNESDDMTPETDIQDETRIMEPVGSDSGAAEKTPESQYLMVCARTPQRGLELAVELLKSLQKATGVKNSVAKISGSKLNKKGMLASAKMLAGKDMIIEEAGDLSAETIGELESFLESDPGDMRILLIDNPKQIEMMTQSYPGLQRWFCLAQTGEEGSVEVETAASSKQPKPSQAQSKQGSRARTRSKKAGVQQAPLMQQTQPEIQAEQPQDQVKPSNRPPVQSQNQPQETSDGRPVRRVKPVRAEYQQPIQKAPVPSQPEVIEDEDEMDIDEFAQYACQYAGEIDCSITGKSMLALYERIEIMEEDNIPLTKANAEGLIEEAADRAEKPSIGKLITGVFSSKYDKDGMLILKEEHFI